VTFSRFLRTPKGLLIIVLVALTALAAAGQGLANVAPVLAGGVVPAMLFDAPILRWRRHRWVFPDGALLTGLIVAMILSPHEPWYVAAVTSVIAVASKYVVRARKANVFNPAALALIVTFYMFDTGQSWWGALPEIAPVAIVVLLAAGVFITQRVNKVPAVLAFLGSYYLLVTASAFVGDPARVAELYRTPDLHAALFFAFFMVTDPPTSPPKHRDQWTFGAIAGVVSYAVFELVGAAYFLLAGLVVANGWEALRRRRSRGAASE
jgi:Na+-translocating ferredoxin:NAD+ oxidoreductase RnfD subunit